MRSYLLLCLVAMSVVSCGNTAEEKPDTAWQREAKFTQFLKLSVESPDSARVEIDRLIERYQGDSIAFRQMTNHLMPYLSDPNSDIRNEELYIPILEAFLAAPYFEQTEKIMPRFMLETAYKNRVGTPAADFEYTLKNGTKGTLYGIESPYTLVYIQNPDCHMCGAIRDELDHSTLLTELQQTGKLKIIAIYPDEDMEIWNRHFEEMPPMWINGYDADLRMKATESYNLQAIPAIYLLDGDKKVILKDIVSVPRVEQYFRAN